MMLTRLAACTCSTGEKHFKLFEPKINNNINVIYYLVLDISELHVPVTPEALATRAESKNI